MPKASRGGKRAGGGAGQLSEKDGWTQFRPGETALNVMDNAKVGAQVELHSLDGQNATYKLTEHTRSDGKTERRWDKVSGNIDNDYLTSSFGDSMAGIMNNTRGLQARKKK